MSSPGADTAGGGENYPQREPRQQSRRRMRELDGETLAFIIFLLTWKYITPQPPILWPKRQREQTHKKGKLCHISQFCLGQTLCSWIFRSLHYEYASRTAAARTDWWAAQPACLPLSPPARRGGKTHLKRRVWNTAKRNKPKQAKPSRGGCVKLHFCYSQGATTNLYSVCFSSVLPGRATARVSQSSYPPFLATVCESW